LGSVEARCFGHAKLAALPAMGLGKGKKAKAKKGKGKSSKKEADDASPRGVDEMGAAEASLLEEALLSFRSPSKEDAGEGRETPPALDAVEEGQSGQSAAEAISAFRGSSRPERRCECCTFWHFADMGDIACPRCTMATTPTAVDVQ
jgi:hypothetical protein